jgi:hypothetical protein
MKRLCYTPQYMESNNEHEWIKQAQARGLDSVLGVALDVLEPLGPLGAQVLWVLQPAAGFLGARDVVREIAEALEEPGGVERIRQQLEK